MSVILVRTAARGYSVYLVLLGEQREICVVDPVSLNHPLLCFLEPLLSVKAGGPLRVRCFTDIASTQVCLLHISVDKHPLHLA